MADKFKVGETIVLPDGTVAVVVNEYETEVAGEATTHYDLATLTANVTGYDPNAESEND